MRDAARAHFERRLREAVRDAERLRVRLNRHVAINFVFLLAALAALSGAWAAASTTYAVLGAVLTVGFAVAYAIHIRAGILLERAERRTQLLDDELSRHGAAAKPPDSSKRAPAVARDSYAPEHPYARDLDFDGPRGVLAWIDRTATERGHQTLAAWLGGRAPLQVARQRQDAVRVLAEHREFRLDLREAGGGEVRFDGDALVAFAQRPALFDRFRWLAFWIHGLPLFTVAAAVAHAAGLVGTALLWPTGLLLQAVTVVASGAWVSEQLAVADRRRGVAEAAEDLLGAALAVPQGAELLDALRRRLQTPVPATSKMRRLRTWLGYADLRQQVPVHFVANLLGLWDLHCLYRLDAWKSEAREHIGDWFDAVAELDALCSLAAVLDADADAALPQLEDSGPMVCEGLVHPLIAEPRRVANDVQLDPHGLWIVTGSNMAGKSTLLRSVGIGVALGLAGGPVFARRMVLPHVRLVAAMRAIDSVQEGASYFRAELDRLRVVVQPDGDAPPLFLLDELLRGTNARARKLGAQAVVLHLLAQEGRGLCATHDEEFARIREKVNNGVVVNEVHFTDVQIAEGVGFDYRLQPGPATTSNALRLLGEIGVHVPDEC